MVVLFPRFVHLILLFRSSFLLVSYHLLSVFVVLCLISLFALPSTKVFILRMPLYERDKLGHIHLFSRVPLDLLHHSWHQNLVISKYRNNNCVRRVPAVRISITYLTYCIFLLFFRSCTWHSVLCVLPSVAVSSQLTIVYLTCVHAPRWSVLIHRLFFKESESCSWPAVNSG